MRAQRIETRDWSRAAILFPQRSMRMLIVGSVGWEPTITLHEIKFGGAFVGIPSIRILNLGQYLQYMYSDTRFFRSAL